MTLPPLSVIRAERARRSLKAFIEATWPLVEPDTQFVSNWHIDLLCARLEAVTRGETQRLIVNIPPGTSKSLIVSVFWPAWEWATNPSLRYLTASYSDSLTIRDNLRVRDICGSAWYRAHFGGGFRADQNAKIRMDTLASGWRIATSVGGRGTGEHPDRIIIDDPTNPKEAHSDAERTAGNDWFDRTVSTRGVSRGARIVLIMQRLHEDDLTGHLLARGGWDHLCLPMRFEAGRASAGDPRTVPGELLWPDVFTPAKVAQLELDLGSYGTAGQLQQRPTPAEGGLLKRSWWNWYREHERPRTFDQIVISWDTALRAKQSNDYTSGQVWARSGPNSYALRMVHGRWDFPELLQQMRDLAKWAKQTYPSVHAQIVIENAGAGPEAIAELRREWPGVIAEAPKGDKQQRVHAVTPIIEAGNVWLPGVARPDGQVDTTLSPAFVDTFVNECASFPFGAHDDQVDAMTQALRRLHRLRTSMGFVDMPGI